jgi:hypothetical protein
LKTRNIRYIVDSQGFKVQQIPQQTRNRPATFGDPVEKAALVRLKKPESRRNPEFWLVFSVFAAIIRL